ncbi:MAG: c-type cytochrome [Terriglobales bacterium]
MGNGRRKGRTAAVVVAVTAAAALWMAAKPARKPAPARPQAMAAAKTQAQGKTAGEVFSNLKVLNNIPASQLFPTMHYFTQALGVKCEFCHVPGDFASDAKPHKRRARQMIRMVEGIDHDNFGGFPAVSCYTCHRGSSHPESVPPLPGTAASAAPLPKGQTGATIYQRYLAAIGGQTAVAQLHSIVEDGTVTGMNGQSVSARVTWRPLATQPFTIGLSFSQFKGQPGPGRWVRELGSQIRAQHAQLVPALNLTQRFRRLRAAGTATIDGQLAYVVVAAGKGGFEQLYFDAQSGLVKRVETYQRLAVGMVPQAVDYSDYLETNGVKTPRTVRITAPRQRATFHFTHVHTS